MEPLRPSDPKRISSYELLNRLGAGGMGQVFLGRSPSGRRVAVKVIRSELTSDATFRERFRREVTAMRAVSGFFTAPVVDADPDGDPAWLATAYVPGPALSEAVRERGPMPQQDVLVLAAGLAEALSAIHKEGLTHRDLKPANVLLAEDGPRVIDFGLAVTAQSSSVTQAGTVVGTPAFMSPEQVSGQQVGPASDVWSLGAVLVFAAVGRSPFGEGGTMEMMFRVVNGDPDFSGLSGTLLQLVQACMQKEAGQRPSPQRILEVLSEGAGVEATAAMGWVPPQATTMPLPATPAGPSYGPSGPQPMAPAQQHTPPQAMPQVTPGQPHTPPQAMPQVAPGQPHTPPHAMAQMPPTAPNYMASQPTMATPQAGSWPSPAYGVPMMPPAPQKKNNTGLILGIVGAVAVVGAVVGGIAVMGSGGGSGSSGGSSSGGTNGGVTPIAADFKLNALISNDDASNYLKGSATADPAIDHPDDDPATYDEHWSVSGSDAELRIQAENYKTNFQSAATDFKNNTSVGATDTAFTSISVPGADQAAIQIVTDPSSGLEHCHIEVLRGSADVMITFVESGDAAAATKDATTIATTIGSRFPAR